MDIALAPAATVVLPAVDATVLSPAARIDALVALQQVRAWVDAAEQRTLAALVGPGDPPRGPRVSPEVAAKQYVREEIACALQVSPMTVNDRLHTARVLVETFPATLAALEAGRVTMRHARTLVEATDPLPDPVLAEVESRVLGRAESETPTQFRRTVARAVLAADPRGADQRHEAARAERRVESRMLPDGMGSLYAVLPAEDLQAVHEVIQAAADAHPEHDAHCAGTRAGRRQAAVPDPDCGGCVSRARTVGQCRADALVGLLTGLDVAMVRSRHGRAPSVQISVALSTLLDLDDEPGDLDGYGPVPADVARRMAGDPSGTWRRLVTDPLGHLLDYGRTTYRPPQDLTDHVIARDRYCRFPGCGRQARSCELDHLHDWDVGGSTNEHNIATGCPRHHHLRHDAGWTVTGSPEGTLTWTTPTGHTYDDPPGRHPIDTTTSGTASSGTASSGTASSDPDPPPF